jgi:GxxExxY protein
MRKYEDGSEQVIAAMIAVHRELGPGLLESAYEACLCRELELRGFGFQRQVPLPILYRGRSVDCAYRIDLLVDRRILIEIKAVEELMPVHAAQVLTYLKLAGVPIGLLVNFNVRVLRDGLRRVSLPLIPS